MAPNGARVARWYALIRATNAPPNGCDERVRDSSAGELAVISLEVSRARSVGARKQSVDRVSVAGYVPALSRSCVSFELN